MTGTLELLELQLGEIHLSETGNDREVFSPAELEELAASMAAVGQLTPVTVRPRPAGGWELVAGERRYRAAGLNGWPTIHAVVRDLSDDDAWAAMLEENLARTDLDPLEECRAMWRRATAYGWTLAEVATKFRRSRSYCADRMALAALCPEVAELVRNGSMTPRRAAMLAELEPAGQRAAVARGADLGADAFRRLCSELLDAERQAGLFELEELRTEIYDQAASRYVDAMADSLDDTAGGAELDLVSSWEVAERAQVDRATVSQWRRRYPTFPAPLAYLGAGRQAPRGARKGEGMPVWNWTDVATWLVTTGRK
jgi:ParB/RepB/Spo0J family partition protein